MKIEEILIKIRLIIFPRDYWHNRLIKYSNHWFFSSSWFFKWSNKSSSLLKALLQYASQVKIPSESESL